MKIISLNFYEEKSNFILVTNVNVKGREEYYVDNQHVKMEPEYDAGYAGFWRIRYKTKNPQD